MNYILIQPNYKTGTNSASGSQHVHSNVSPLEIINRRHNE